MNIRNDFYDRDERLTYFVKHQSYQNFGDYLPELFSKYILKYPIVQADLYYFVGSVIDEVWIRRALRQNRGLPSGKVAFWGCGKRDERPLPPRARALCDFYGVRGPLTRDALDLPAETPLGDTGFLTPLIYFSHPKKAQTLSNPENTICIPHVSERKSDEELLKMSGCASVVRPRINADERSLREILDTIRSADFVLSNSLHGAIIACAYDVPFAMWDSGYVDIPFKWSDFAQSINLDATFVSNLAEGISFYGDIRGKVEKPKLSPLLEVAPWQCRTDVLLRALDRDGFDLSDTERLVAYFEDRARHDMSRQPNIDGENRAYRLRKERFLVEFSAKLSKRAQSLKRRLQRA